MFLPVTAISLKLNDTAAILPYILGNVPDATSSPAIVRIGVGDIQELLVKRSRALIGGRPAHVDPMSVDSAVHFNFPVHVSRVIIRMVEQIRLVFPLRDATYTASIAALIPDGIVETRPVWLGEIALITVVSDFSVYIALVEVKLPLCGVIGVRIRPGKIIAIIPVHILRK